MDWQASLVRPGLGHGLTSGLGYSDRNETIDTDTRGRIGGSSQTLIQDSLRDGDCTKPCSALTGLPAVSGVSWQELTVITQQNSRSGSRKGKRPRSPGTRRIHGEEPRSEGLDPYQDRQAKQDFDQHKIQTQG